ncbi:MAG: LamG-like jellyroll fold domain-containing protein [Verrucomicrobiota bacterium]
MKRNLFTKSLKRGLLAVPAAALMLGAAHAQTTIGFNFQAWYYDSGTTPQTIGYGAGYQTTGFPVTATAFGVPTPDWTNTDPLDCQSTISQNIPWGVLNVNVAAGNMWQSGIGGLSEGWVPQTVTPGNDEVTWGYLDDTAGGYYVTISGLRAICSNFTIQTIAAIGGTKPGFPDVELTTMVTNIQYLNYTNTGGYYDVTSAFGSGTVGTSSVSTVYTTLSGNDSVKIHGMPRGGADDLRSTLAGILLTYTPGNNPPLIEVNPQTPAGQVFVGDSFSLSAQASGSPTLHYQWRKGVTELAGANFASYTNSAAGLGDTGGYNVVVTNAYGSVTSTVAPVTILDVTPPVITKAPVSQSLYQGYSVSFSVEATGGKLAYQWKTNAVAIPGATNATFAIPSITANSAGTYTVDVSNPVGPTASASATLAVKVPASGSYEAAVAQTKPLVWFRDSETEVPLVDTGAAANSGSTGTSDNGVAKFYTTFQQPGAIVDDANKSASFNGAQAIDVPFDAALNTASFTVELWAKAATIDNGAISPLYNRGANTIDGWLFFANNGSAIWTFRTYEGSTRNTINSTAPVVANSWTHLVGVYDAVTTTTRFYVNGVEQGSGLFGTFTPNSSVPLRIGAAANDTGAAGVNAWKGGVDEVALYDTVLTPADILSHYQNGTNAARVTPYSTLVQASTPVGYWRLNDPTGPIPPAPSNSGTLGVAWNGAYAGDTLPGIAGPRPPGQPGLEANNLAVSMTSGYISAPITTNLNVNTITVAGWLNRAADSSTGDLSWPAWLGDGGMHMVDGTGELRYHWKGGNWGWASGLFVPADVWTFVAMVIEPTKATFYMADGTNLQTSVNTTAHAALAVTSPLGFGGNQPTRGDRNYIGQLDEFAVYNRALTQGEINTLFMVGTGAPLTVGLQPGGIIEDSKPVGTPHNGANYLTTWLASSTDAAGTPVTRTGVEQFTTVANSQISVPAGTDFDSTIGTFTFWMRIPVAAIPGPGSEGAMLMDRRTDNGAVIVLNDAGSIFVQCAGTANSLTSSALLADDLWHHIAVTYNQANGAFIEIYVDGVLSGSQANSSAWSWPTAQPVEIGRSHSSYWKRFDGQMDDFRIYNRVLTAGEIASIRVSDALVDNAALKLRFNFSTSGIGRSVTWPFGTLLSSPVLGPAAVWTPVPGAQVPVYPFMPTEAAKFFRATP